MSRVLRVQKPGDCVHGTWTLDTEGNSSSCDWTQDGTASTALEWTCPEDDDGPCNGNGVCDLATNPDKPTCTCNLGWFGEDCSILPCPNDCGRNEERISW